MKRIMRISLIVSLIGFICTITMDIVGSYQYERDYQSYWNLADKASTIEQKAEYIDKYVNAIENGDMSGYNAIIFTTPDNSFDQNLIALKSLQGRLHEISKMNVNSFEYQTAISQITEQEQGEAYKMIKTFEGIWWKCHYILLWDWIGTLTIAICTILLVLSLVLVLITHTID
jgi:hypothetical protein